MMARKGTEGTKQTIVGAEITQTIDLTQHLNIDEFDKVVRGLDHVLNKSEALALDNTADRRVLFDRLLFVLGGVP